MGKLQVESLNDIRLAGRAMKEGWNVTPEHKQEILSQLMGHLRDPDPKYSIAAAKAIMAADALDAKREAINNAKAGGDDDRRLRLLELARRVPVGELAKLASDNGTIIDAAGRTEG